jgi:hypothetical protein|tara:strand:- start:5 stop:148 length:144 start_codon:yes stop_codon:yes gene_type:complete
MTDREKKDFVIKICAGVGYTARETFGFLLQFGVDTAYDICENIKINA